MRSKFTQSFKIQAVEKALNRSSTTTLKEVADSRFKGKLGYNWRQCRSARRDMKGFTLEMRHFLRRGV